MPLNGINKFVPSTGLAVVMDSYRQSRDSIQRCLDAREKLPYTYRLSLLLEYPEFIPAVTPAEDIGAILEYSCWGRYQMEPDPNKED
jgi:hypothetical protein